MICICHLLRKYCNINFPILVGGNQHFLFKLFVPVQNDAIQIHFVSGSHWVTSSSVGQVLSVYDSKFKGSHLTSSLTHQLCQIYKALIQINKGEEESAGKLVVNVTQVQQQSGSSDCGIFAIAYALHNVLGHSLAETKFNQAMKRSHLLKCFTSRFFTPFPTIEISEPRMIKPLSLEISVYCTCMMPDTFDDMVQCGTCRKWYHMKCIGLSKLPDAKEEWNCSYCYVVIYIMCCIYSIS